MKKTLLIATLTCSTLMCLSISAGTMNSTPVAGVLCNFDHEVPNEWFERDSGFFIPAPSSEVDSNFSLRHGETNNDIRYVPITVPENENSNMHTVVPISPESNNSERNIISIIPIG